MEANKPHALFLTSWYPNEKDIQLGIFVKKQAMAASAHAKVTLIYLTSGKEHSVKTTSINPNFEETVAYIPERKGIWGTLRKINSWKKTYLNLISNIAGKPDLIHVHNGFPIGILIPYLKKKLNVPIIYSESWSGFVNQKKIPFYKLSIFKRLANHSDLILPVSNFLKEGMVDAGIKGNFKLVGNVIESSNTLLPRPSKSTHKMKLLVVSDLDDSIKNISGIISAFSKANLPSSELHIVGDGNDRKLLEQHGKEHSKPEKTIFFHGRQSNTWVLNELISFDFGIINSNYETFGMVGAEFVLNGLPIITTNCGGPLEYFDSSMGIMIDVQNEIALTQAIEKMSHTFKSFQLNSSKKKLEDKFSMEAIGDKLSQHYLNLLKQETS